MVRVRRVVVPVLLILLALPVIGFAAEKQTRPPRELHKVGDHWTAYTPPDPATFPANAKTYTIAKGDTLWSLAKQFYSNAYLWPQLWEANTYITDAHWIYPGDPLMVQGEAASGQVATGTTVGGEVGTGGEEARAEPTAEASGSASVGNPLPLGTEADI